jgi:hypothetical protein
MMNKRTKRWVSGIALGAAALGAIGAIVVNRGRRPRNNRELPDRWARPGMKVTFRAELMPGRDAAERTFQITDLLPSGRVLLDRVAGEHAQN